LTGQAPWRRGKVLGFAADLAYILYALLKVLNDVVYYLVFGIVNYIPAYYNQTSGVPSLIANMTNSTLTLFGVVLYQLDYAYNAAPSLAVLIKHLVNFFTKVLYNIVTLP